MSYSGYGGSNAGPECLLRYFDFEYGTVVWPGGIDVAPETLFDDSVPF